MIATEAEARAEGLRQAKLTPPTHTPLTFLIWQLPQGALESQDLAGFCERKAAAAPTERDRTEWELMQVVKSPNEYEQIAEWI